MASCLLLVEEKQLVEELEFVSVKAMAHSSSEADKRRCSRENQTRKRVLSERRGTKGAGRQKDGRKERKLSLIDRQVCY